MKCLLLSFLCWLIPFNGLDGSISLLLFLLLSTPPANRHFVFIHWVFSLSLQRPRIRSCFRRTQTTTIAFALESISRTSAIDIALMLVSNDLFSFLAGTTPAKSPRAQFSSDLSGRWKRVCANGICLAASCLEGNFKWWPVC